MPPRISVVVPTYNRASLLPRLIDALERQTLHTNEFEVLIVDDASGDDTAKVLADLVSHSRLQLRVMRHDVNRGPAPARNLAWREAKAPIVAFTDDDCAAAPRWLEAGLAALEDEIGIVQGKTLPDPSTTRRRWSVTQEITSFTNRYETCNVFFRRDLLDAVGGFDEGIGFFGEDMAAGWAARRLGAQAAFAPDAVVFHTVTHPGLGWHLRRARMYRNWATLLRRHPEMRPEVLHLGAFLRPRDVRILAGAAGIIAGLAWRPAFALVLPYAWEFRPRRLSPEHMVEIMGDIVIDLAIFRGIVTGSVKERTLVL